MIICKSAQGTSGWIEDRCGILSASELGELVKLNFDLRTGEMVQTLLARKLAEKWSGPLAASGAGAFEGSWAMIQGQILEEQALPWLEFTQNVEIQRPGFLMTDDRLFGASPDGIIGTGMGLEVKCKQPVAHCKMILDGEVPGEHLAQIHAGMHVTGFTKWMFLGYHRNFPKLLLTVERDSDIQCKINKAVCYFNEMLNDGWIRLCELNGGPPPPRERMLFSTDRPEQFNAH